MPKGPLYKAAENGDVGASIAVIRVAGQMQKLPRLSTYTPQQVRSLLASGIQPDAERDEVSVFWCRLV